MKSPRNEQERLRPSTETLLYLEGGKVVRSQQRGWKEMVTEVGKELREGRVLEGKRESISRR